MSSENILVALEIGTSKVCCVAADSRPDGSLKILGVGQAPSRGVRKGEIVDFDAAHKCVREALAEAEEKSGLSIRKVYLGLSGAHIEALNNRGGVQLPDDRDEIDEGDLEDVNASACEVSIPSENAFLHSIPQNYYVDGQDGVISPVGLIGHRLEADYHIVHGVRTRVQNSIRCVKEIPVHVEDVVFNPLASAQVVLDQSQRDLGALVIDMGGGTTDYAVYVDGVVRQSGVLAVGGDHITNDISMGLRIPMGRAERLKIEEGHAQLGTCLPGETVLLPSEPGFAGKEVERDLLNGIINARLRESFELLRRRLDQEPDVRYLGAGAVLTGGCSLIRGVIPIAEETLGMPVQLAPTLPLSGLVSALANPQLSAVIGVIKFVQLRAESDRPKASVIARLTGWFFGRKR